MDDRIANGPDWGGVVKAVSGDIRRLDDVWRYSSIPIVHSEATSTHSFWVTLYSALILKELGGEAMDPAIVAPVLLYATVHDSAECVTGDIIRLMKYATPEMKAAVDAAEEILSEKHLHPTITSLIKEAGVLASACPGSKAFVKGVVKVADFMSLFQFMRREAMRGNLEISPFFQRMEDDFAMMSTTSPPLEYGKGLVFDQAKVYEELTRESALVRKICFRGLQDA